MGQYLFRLPDIGEGVAEAEITAWHVRPGDHIQEDAPLLDVMTDKATVDMTSPVEGTITALHGEVGSMAPVGSVLVEMEVAGEKPAAPEPKPVAAKPDAPAEKELARNARSGETASIEQTRSGICRKYYNTLLYCPLCRPDSGIGTQRVAFAVDTRK